MHTYYLSLCRGLIGYYVKFLAPNEEVVRVHAAEYFGRIWCSVYDEAYFESRIRGRYPNTNVINADKPIELEDPEWE